MSEYINLTDVLKTAEHILTTSVQNSAEFGRETEFQFTTKSGYLFSYLMKLDYVMKISAASPLASVSTKKNRNWAIN